jgi:hypothetical protein
MARLEPSINDREPDLWFKAAWNMYEWGIENGVTGLTPPRIGEPVFSLQKKLVYYSAAIASAS